MDNPLDLALPSDPFQKIHDFARDLAYGSVMQYWSSGITSTMMAGREEFILHQPYKGDWLERFDQKWGADHPACQVLASFGYLKLDELGSSGSYIYSLTPKAFQLLERPLVLPSVFISYARKYSSALGLLIECKLQSSGIQAFIDRSIDPGDEWHAQLEAKVRSSKCLVTLIAPKTLDSAYVCREIRWALDAGMMVIPIWQVGYVGEALPAELAALDTKNAIRIQEESAEAYHDAVEKLVNRLGILTP